MEGNFMVLPPKRFQCPSDSKYDPIRFRPWFGDLFERREKLPWLKLARAEWRGNGVDQVRAADMFNVDARELRDYDNFVMGVERPRLPSFQPILDDSYRQYVSCHGEWSIRAIIERNAPLWGVNPRHVVECWEVDPQFYPTGYRPSCPKCGEDYAMVKHKDGRWVCHKTHSL